MFVSVVELHQREAQKYHDSRDLLHTNNARKNLTKYIAEVFVSKLGRISHFSLVTLCLIRRIVLRIAMSVHPEDGRYASSVSAQMGKQVDAE